MAKQRTYISNNAFVVSFVVALLACGGGALCSAFRTGSTLTLNRNANANTNTNTNTNAGLSRRATAAAATTGEESSSSSSYTIPENVVSNNALAEANGYPAIILSPCLDAADPEYACKGSIDSNTNDNNDSNNDDGVFVVSRYGGPTAEELASENLVRIVARRSNVTDLQVNTLAWKCLGYRFVESNSSNNDDSNNDNDKDEWTSPEVFPKWKERYPTPPDLIGMQRVYTKEIDGELIKNNQRLAVSVPLENKQSLKTFLKEPYGFSGYKLSELTPNLTRRAQVTNWLLYYREELFGVTLDELRERRRVKQQKEEEHERKRLADGDQEKPWKPPLKEVY